MKKITKRYTVRFGYFDGHTTHWHQWGRYSRRRAAESNARWLLKRYDHRAAKWLLKPQVERMDDNGRYIPVT